MPGDYLFPRRRVRSPGDILDADEANQMLTPPAERLNGALNQHNIKAPLPQANAPLGKSTFVSVTSKAVFVEPSIDFEIPPYGGSKAGRAWEDRFDLYPSLSWQRISNDGAADEKDAAISLVTGRSMLSLRASLWYSYQPDAATKPNSPARVVWAEEGADNTSASMESLASRSTSASKINHRASVQFALRVDGVVLQETITGRIDIEQRPFYPLRVQSPRKNTSHQNVASGASFEPATDQNMSGPTTPRFSNRIEGVNYTVAPIRMGFHILVEPGEHLIELVGRRCSEGQRAVVPSMVSVYSRQLAVYSLPLDETLTSPTTAAVSVRDVDPETTFSKSEVGTQRLDALKDASNAVEPGQLSRAALNRYHLANRSLVVGTAIGIDGVPGSMSGLTVTTGNSGSSRTYSSAGPGVPASYSPLSTTGTVLSWTSKYDLVALPSNFLVDINKCSLSLPLHTPQYLTVLGNVALEKLHIQAGPGIIGPGNNEMTHACGIACFGIYFEFISGVYAYRPSMVFINSANYMSYTTRTTPGGGSSGGGRSYAVNAEVPLMAVFDFSDANDLPTDSPFRVGIFSGLTNVALNATSPTTATVARSSVQVFSLRSEG
jgi:hypothetical protein